MAKPLTDNSFDFTTSLGVYHIEADNPAKLNALWGDIASQMGQLGVMGKHSSSHGTFTPDPGEGGRTGVGNLSKDDPRFQIGDSADTPGNAGTNGTHAISQAVLLGNPNLPLSVERDIGPLFPDGNHPGITITFTPFDSIL